MQQAEKCPVCKIDWPGDKFVGEKAITASDGHGHGHRHGQRRNTSGRHLSGIGVGASASIGDVGVSGGD